MIVFPNCKINLGLHVLEKRSDGYHNIETVFYPVPFHDALEWVPSNGSTSIQSSGFPSGPDSGNLALRAYQLLKKDFPHMGEANIFLHKAIPPGAGLGGGSSDGAYALQMFASAFRLPLTASQLADYAFRLGSDCPFFLHNKACLASGRGEILKEIPLSLAGYKIVLVYPSFHISTREAFGGISPTRPASPLSRIITQPVTRWKNLLFNDFERSLFPKYPLLENLKNDFYSKGAVYASLSGSGSTVYGLFSKETHFKPAQSSYLWKEFILQ